MRKVHLRPNTLILRIRLSLTHKESRLRIRYFTLKDLYAKVTKVTHKIFVYAQVLCLRKRSNLTLKVRLRINLCVKDHKEEKMKRRLEDHDHKTNLPLVDF